MTAVFKRDRSCFKERRNAGPMRRANTDPKKNYYNRFVRWAERGVWEEIFAALAGSEGEPDRLMIDSTFIKNHRCSGGGKGGPSYMLLVAAKADGQQKFTS